MKKYLTFSLFISVVLFTVTLTNCGRGHSQVEPGHQTAIVSRPNLKVGVVLPLTGILSVMGQYERQAMELALRDLQTQGHQEISLIFEDGKGDSKTAVAAANKLLSIDKTKILITSTSGASMAVKPVAEGQGVTLLAFCMDSALAASSKTTIRYYIGLEEESRAIVNYLCSLPSNRKVGILHGSVAAWVNAVKNIYRPKLSQHFVNPPLIEEYDIKARDFRAQLTKMKTSGIKVMVILGYGFEYGPMFDQMAELKLRDSVNIVGGWGFLYTTLPPTTTEGIHVAGPTYIFQQSEKGNLFNLAFEKAYGHTANFDAAFAYELVSSLPEISSLVEQAGATGLKSRLVDKGDIEGVMGLYHFSADGNMIVKTAMGVFRNGRIVGQ